MGGALHRNPELWFLEICEAKNSGIQEILQEISLGLSG
jgi:hypothetical protein